MADPEIVFKTLAERKPGESWISMIYGSTGSGKTYFAGTAGPRTLYLNVGDGLETLKSPAFTKRYPESSGMITVDIDNVQSSTAGFDQIVKIIEKAYKEYNDKFDTVVLDESTAFRRLALNKAMDLNSAQRKDSRKSREDDYVKAEIGDYGIEMDMISWFLGTYIPIFKNTKKNFLMLAHERQIYGKPAKQGDEPPLKRILPGFTGQKFPDQVPAYFDDVWRSEVAGKINKVYRIITEGDELVVGKSRHGGIFERVENDPNFLKMLSRIQNSSSKL